MENRSVADCSILFLLLSSTILSKNALQLFLEKTILFSCCDIIHSRAICWFFWRNFVINQDLIKDVHGQWHLRGWLIIFDCRGGLRKMSYNRRKAAKQKSICASSFVLIFDGERASRTKWSMQKGCSACEPDPESSQSSCDFEAGRTRNRAHGKPAQFARVCDQS